MHIVSQPTTYIVCICTSESFMLKIGCYAIYRLVESSLVTIVDQSQDFLSTICQHVHTHY